MTSSGRSDGRRRIQCSGRAQGSGCTEPTFYADMVESQIGALISGFQIPEEHRARLMREWQRAQRCDASVEAKRRQLERQQVRLRDLYLVGDLNRVEYQQRRDATQRELDTLPVATGSDDGSAGRLLEYLADVANAWAVATPEERNRLARELFSETVVTNKTVVAVVPRPEVRPFLVSIVGHEITQQRKRRGSCAR